MWRCASNIMGYCDGEPEWDRKSVDMGVIDDEYRPIPIIVGAMGRGTCKHTWNSCDRFSYHSQVVVSNKKDGGS